MATKSLSESWPPRIDNTGKNDSSMGLINGLYVWKRKSRASWRFGYHSCDIVEIPKILSQGANWPETATSIHSCFCVAKQDLYQLE